MLVPKHLEMKELLLTGVGETLFTLFLIQVFFFCAVLYGMCWFFPWCSVWEERKGQELCSVLCPQRGTRWKTLHMLWVQNQKGLWNNILDVLAWAVHRSHFLTVNVFFLLQVSSGYTFYLFYFVYYLLCLVTMRLWKFYVGTFCFHLIVMQINSWNKSWQAVLASAVQWSFCTMGLNWNST